MILFGKTINRHPQHAAIRKAQNASISFTLPSQRETPLGDPIGRPRHLQLSIGVTLTSIDSATTNACVALGALRTTSALLTRFLDRRLPTASDNR